MLNQGTSNLFGQTGRHEISLNTRKKKNNYSLRLHEFVIEVPMVTFLYISIPSLGIQNPGSNLKPIRKAYVHLH